MEEQEELKEVEEDRMAGWRLLNCSTVTTGTVRKNQSWLSSIGYGGNVVHANYFPLSE